MQQTLIVIKPDAVQRGLTGRIIDRFEAKGLQVVALKMVQLDAEQARRMYSVHQGKPFYEPLVKFITAAPVVAMVVAGQEAVAAARKLMGSTNAVEAEAGTIRGDWALSRRLNLVHGSDSAESAAREIPLFFAPQEICGYRQGPEEWIYGNTPATGGDL